MSAELAASARMCQPFPGLDEAAVSHLAKALALTAPGQGLVFLEGALGAGKTTFARAFLRALGVAGPVRSPTYTLIEPYDLVDGALLDPDQGAIGGPDRVLHLDLYRLGSPDELDYLGLRDEFDRALILIEWPIRAASELPCPDLEIQLAATGSAEPDRRHVMLIARTVPGTDWLKACQSRYAMRGG